MSCYQKIYSKGPLVCVGTSTGVAQFFAISCSTYPIGALIIVIQEGPVHKVVCAMVVCWTYASIRA